MSAFDAARRAMRRILSKPDNNLSPGLSARAFAEHVSGVPNSSMIWCDRDRVPLLPVVVGLGGQAEVIGLGCVRCGGRIGVQNGVLIDGAAPEAASFLL